MWPRLGRKISALFLYEQSNLYLGGKHSNNDLFVK